MTAPHRSSETVHQFEALNVRVAIVAEAETPDFLAKDTDGRTVGIELTQIRFSPQERVTRAIYPPEPHDPDAFLDALSLMRKKDGGSGRARLERDRAQRRAARTAQAVGSKLKARAPL